MKFKYHKNMNFSKPDNARRINRLRVLNSLRKVSLSRAELSRELSISKVSISDIVESLEKDKLIEEADLDMSTDGRPAKKLRVNKNSGRVFAIEIKSNTVSVSISDMIGRPLRFERFPRTENMWEDIIRVTDKLKQDYKVYGACIVSAENIEPENLPFEYIITTPVIAQASAEINLATLDMNDFYFVSWSDRIEAVLFHNILVPISSFAHIKVTKEAPCECGGNGCLEAVASGDILKSTTGLTHWAELVNTKEVTEASKSLVFALSQAVQATGAKAAMLLGELSQLSDDQYAMMQTRLSMLLPPQRDNVFIYRSQCAERGAREGAGIIALDRFFYKTDLVKAIMELQSEE